MYNGIHLAIDHLRLVVETVDDWWVEPPLVLSAEILERRERNTCLELLGRYSIEKIIAVPRVVSSDYSTDIQYVWYGVPCKEAQDVRLHQGSGELFRRV